MESINKNIDHGKGFDWGRTSEDYAKFRDIYPECFYEKIIEMGLCLKGQRVLDLGTGTGVLPRNLYKYGAEFVGADISENQIAQARRLSQQANMNISYVVSPAETLDFPEKYFDAVTACQCYAYFDKNIIFKKMHSLLKDAGHFCVLYVIYLPGESDIARRSDELVLKYNPSWSGGRAERYTYEFPKQAKGLFKLESSFCYDVPIQFTRESWHGRMKTCRGISAATCISKEDMTAWEKEHLEYLQSAPEVFEMPHFITVLNLRKT